MRPPVHLLLILAILAPTQTWAGSANWNVGAEQSSVTFSATQVGQSFTGKFKAFKAQIRFDPADLASAHVLATIDMSSVDAGDGQRNIALPTSDWFDSQVFPSATFEATSFTALAAGKYEARGTLTIRGVAQEILLPFSLDIDGDKANMQGEVTIIRTDYGVGQGQWQSGQWVGLEVKIIVEIVATRASE